MYLTAYYFRQHQYTLVPKHLREDFQWMTDAGCDAVAIAVLEQDPKAIPANFDHMFHEAERAGLDIWIVPSRWGGVVAGSPKVPSMYAASTPHVWSLDAQGNPNIFMGPMCSVHHPDSAAFFQQQFDVTLGRWPFAGIIWDELKNLQKPDHCDAAKAKIRTEGLDPAMLDAPEWIAQQSVGFFDAMTEYAASVRSGLKSGLFIYGHLPQYIIDACCSMQHVEVVGLDGRPYTLQPKPEAEHHPNKSLIDQGPSFKATATAHGKQSLMLIENHDMPEELYDNMQRELPATLAMDFDHVLFYYYPRNLTDPDRQMQIIKDAMKIHARQG